MKCVATIKNGNIESIDKVSDGYTRNGSCIDIIVNGKDKTFSVKDLKDGVYYCPKELWKQRVRDAGKVKADTVAETKATKATKTKKAKKETK